MGKFLEHSASRLMACTITAILLTVAASARAESFDAPLQQRVVDMGRSPYSNGHGKLTCDYFASFMVKQLDFGGEGADWIAIAPARTAHPPACTRAHLQRETVIPGRDWCGYFQGAKQDFVFLNACNYYNGGSDFAVYDAHTGARIFQDTAVDPASGGLQFTRAPDGGLALRYSRIVVFACTLPRDQTSCWARIESKLGLENAAIPTCTSYEKQMTGSVIAYPVEVALKPTPGIRTVAGQIRCWPPE